MATSDWKYFSSPNYPGDYGNNEDIIWKLDTHSSIIQLQVVDFSLNSGDHVIIKDGETSSSSIIADLDSHDNGHINDEIYYSTGSHMLVHFTSDYRYTSKGFKLQYKGVSNYCDIPLCRNGGTCTYEDDSYICTCKEGYIGNECEGT